MFLDRNRKSASVSNSGIGSELDSMLIYDARGGFTRVQANTWSSHEPAWHIFRVHEYLRFFYSAYPGGITHIIAVHLWTVTHFPHGSWRSRPFVHRRPPPPVSCDTRQHKWRGLPKFDWSYRTNTKERSPFENSGELSSAKQGKFL